MRTLLLMQTGDVSEPMNKTTGNFEQIFLRAADYDGFEVEIVHVARGEKPGPFSDYAGVIVTGSPAMVTDHEDWSERSGCWLAEAVKSGVPVFGVCYGHQLMAHALGGRVAFHPGGLELGTHQVTLTEDGRAHPLLYGLPAFFQGNMAHSQTVICPPEGAVVLAYSAHDRHQILAYGERSVSVQFHPEFAAADMQAYVNFKSGPGVTPIPMRLGVPVRNTPLAAGILQRFITVCK